MTDLKTAPRGSIQAGEGIASVQLHINADWQTQARGTNDSEYQIYRALANDGKGGDITRNGAPLLSYDEWMTR